MKFGTRWQRRRDRDASRGWGMRMGYPLPSHLRGLGSVVSSTAGSGAPPRPKTNLGHIKRRRTRLWLWWKIGYIVFCETFITAYTSARTVTGHLLAKIATVHYSVNLKAKIKGEKPEIRIILLVTFLLSENSGYYPVPNGAVRNTGHSIRIRDCPEKFGRVGNPIYIAQM